MIRIYVACLAAYNAGYLHGQWLDLDDYDDVDELFADVNKMLAMSPIPDAEEFAIHDYEAEVSGIEISEYASLENIVRLNAALNAAHDAEAFAAFYVYHGRDLDYAEEKFDEAFRGLHESIEDFAHEELMELDEAYAAAFEGCRGWMPRIDTIAFHQDYDVIDAPRGVYVFANH
ncbi:antirestriction protein ArdA [Spirillospora sp. NPDC127200]